MLGKWHCLIAQPQCQTAEGVRTGRRPSFAVSGAAPTTTVYGASAGEEPMSTPCSPNLPVDRRHKTAKQQTLSEVR